MRIADRIIGRDNPPFIIAEMSGNHNQSLKKALEIVQAASDSGADAIKIQTYTPDSITLDCHGGDFLIDDRDSPWYGQSLYQLYSKASTPYDWHQPIMERAEELGIICFSTPFDEKGVDFLENLGVPLYKIASFECSHLSLIRRVAETGKPLILSTGMATLAQIDEAVTTARAAGCEDLVLLKCTSSYPASPENSNILTIPHMRELFQCEVGLSDHTLGFGTAAAAIAHGATVIEKHLTLSRAEGGVDSGFSMEPKEFSIMVEESQKAWQSLGGIHYGPTDAERGSLRFRRSIFIKEDMKPGDVFSESNLCCIRPGSGLPPKYLDVIIGKKINRDAARGTPMSWDFIG